VAEGDDLVCNGRVVSLIEIRTGEDGSRVAIIQVDTTIYEVAAGDTFAGNFVVQSISETEVSSSTATTSTVSRWVTAS
jgi:hypothetical protein